MMSVDFRQLELVNQFSSLLEVLANSDKLQQTIKDAKEALEGNKALLGPLAIKENADKNLAESARMLEMTREQVEKEFKLADEQAAVTKAAAEAQLAQAAADLKEASEAKAEAKKVLASTKEEQEKIKVLRGSLEVEQESLKLKTDEYNSLIAALKDKQEKLSALLGA